MTRNNIFEFSFLQFDFIFISINEKSRGNYSNQKLFIKVLKLVISMTESLFNQKLFIKFVKLAIWRAMLNKGNIISLK